MQQITVRICGIFLMKKSKEANWPLNCFSFAGNYYKQSNGVAMGTKMGPSYANLFVGYVGYQFFNQYDGPKPDLYGRYIDDCIGAISSSREELNHFITSVNSFHPALKYTWEISETSLAFLDIKVSISGNGLCTSVHYKPTDSHSYLLHSSSHARHFNLPNHSKEHMSICGLSLHQVTTDSRKNLEQRFIFQIGTDYPHGINERFSFN